ncbi:MAG: Xaa-Pro dipeptidase [Limisphaerales bacterium]
MTGVTDPQTTQTGPAIHPNQTGMFQDHINHTNATWAESLTACKFDGVWIAAGDTKTNFQDDHGPTFKPNPYFTQWVDPEFAQPGAHILLRPDHDQPIVLFTLQAEDYWHAVAPLPEYLGGSIVTRAFADSTSLTAAAREETIKGAYAYIGETSNNEISGQLNPTALLNRMDFRRATKTAYEIEIMRRASDIGALGHLAAADSFANGGTEFDIHMAYLLASKQNENELPYGNIVALNEHAAILHYQLQDRVHHSAAKSLLIDAGGQYAGYASDITRTYASEGEVHRDFGDLINAMTAHQKRILDSVGTDKSFADLHAYMHRSLCDVLVEAELVTCSAEEAFDLRINETFCPHGLGHLLGIQVHDVGGHLGDAEGTPLPPAENYPSLRFTRAITEDQVFTIEPGLYFIERLLAEQRAKGAPINWSSVDALQPYGGIRIEDNIRVLAEGIENLTRDAWQRLTAHG